MSFYGLVLYLKDGTGETTTAKINLSKEVPVDRLAKLQVGDKLILDIDTLPAKDLTAPPCTDPNMGPVCDRGCWTFIYRYLQ